jgi:hypothetical protein
MGALEAIQVQLGVSAIRTAQADSESGASTIELRKEQRVELREEIEAAEEEADAIDDQILEEHAEASRKVPDFFENPFKAIAGWVERLADGANPGKHDEIEDLVVDAKQVQASLERDQTRLEILGDEQKSEYGSVIESDDSMRDELSALEEIDTQLGKLRSFA